MEELDSLPLLSEDDEAKLSATKLPYNGLLGDSVLLRVIEEIVADPHREFRPKKLQILTSSSAPRIKNALDALVAHGLLEKKSTDKQRPAYLVNLDDKRLTALTLLAYAVHDVRDETDCMNQAIKSYCSEVFVEQLMGATTEKCYISIENHITYNVSWTPQNIDVPLDSIDFTKINVNSARPQSLAISGGV